MMKVTRRDDWQMEEGRFRLSLQRERISVYVDDRVGESLGLLPYTYLLQLDLCDFGALLAFLEEARDRINGKRL